MSTANYYDDLYAQQFGEAITAEKKDAAVVLRIRDDNKPYEDDSHHDSEGARKIFPCRWRKLCTCGCRAVFPDHSTMGMVFGEANRTVTNHPFDRKMKGWPRDSTHFDKFYEEQFGKKISFNKKAAMVVVADGAGKHWCWRELCACGCRGVLTDNTVTEKIGTKTFLHSHRK